jgi:hypothetical protein
MDHGSDREREREREGRTAVAAGIRVEDEL